MQVINKVCPLTSSLELNIIEFTSSKVQLQLFWHSFQNWTRWYFFWVIAQVGVVSSLPSQLNATVGNKIVFWQGCSKLRAALGRWHEHRAWTKATERRAVGGLFGKSSLLVLLSQMMKHHQQFILTPLILFCQQEWQLLGGTLAMLDTFLHHAAFSMGLIVTWKKLSWNALKYWSPSIVQPVSGRMLLIWGWAAVPSRATTLSPMYSHCNTGVCARPCQLSNMCWMSLGTCKFSGLGSAAFHFAIEAMHNVGVAFYSSFATLSRWHQKFACHR